MPVAYIRPTFLLKFLFFHYLHTCIAAQWTWGGYQWILMHSAFSPGSCILVHDRRGNQYQYAETKLQLRDGSYPYQIFINTVELQVYTLHFASRSDFQSVSFVYKTELKSVQYHSRSIVYRQPAAQYVNPKSFRLQQSLDLFSFHSLSVNLII